MITKRPACVTMRPMPHLLRLPRMAALALLFGMAALSACSSDGKTVVALTINSDDTVGVVDHIVVTASGANKAPVPTTIMPKGQPDSGVIIPSFYTRIELPGWTGDVELKVEAFSAAGTVIATKTTTVKLEENGAVAARVSLTTKPPEPPKSDAGSDAGSDAEADGGAN